MSLLGSTMGWPVKGEKKKGSKEEGGKTATCLRGALAEDLTPQPRFCRVW